MMQKLQESSEKIELGIKKVKTLSLQGIKKRQLGNEEEEIQRVIVMVSHYDSKWLEYIKKEDLFALQYMYISYLQISGQKIFTKEEYQNLLKSKEFQDYKANQTSQLFEALLKETDIPEQILSKIKFDEVF